MISDKDDARIRSRLLEEFPELPDILQDVVAELINESYKFQGLYRAELEEALQRTMDSSDVSITLEHGRNPTYSVFLEQGGKVAAWLYPKPEGSPNEVHLALFNAVDFSGGSFPALRSFLSDRNYCIMDKCS